MNYIQPSIQAPAGIPQPPRFPEPKIPCSDWVGQPVDWEEFDGMVNKASFACKD